LAESPGASLVAKVSIVENKALDFSKNRAEGVVSRSTFSLPVPSLVALPQGNTTRQKEQIQYREQHTRNLSG
jgi:hypothetical protein